MARQTSKREIVGGTRRGPACRLIAALFLCLIIILPASPALAEPAAGVVRLAFVGDIMVGRHIAEIIAEEGTAFPFEKVRQFIEPADLAFGNMESPLATTERVAGGYDLRADPANSEVASLAGFDILSLANNHATDNGRDGLLQTMDTLTDLGIEWVGAAETLDEARTVRVLIVDGLRIGFLAYDGTRASYMASAEERGCAWLEPDWVVVDIKNARETVDILVVSVHWGAEYESLPNDYQRTVAGRMAAAGADIIIGHHPHVVQPVEWLTGEGRDHPTLVAYSLGNFLFDQWFSDETMQSAILHCTISAAGVEAFGLHPVQNIDGQIVPADEANSAAVLSRLLPATTGQGWQMVSATGAGIEPAVWHFVADANGEADPTLVDFDGDDAAERVVLAGGRAWVYVAGNVTLASPPGWSVYGWTSLPAQDGERLLALSVGEPPMREAASAPAGRDPIWQRGGSNHTSMRLYLLRWSGDAWAPVHRSRPLRAPIRELACTTGASCVALEDAGDGLTRLAGWSWNGQAWSRRWSGPAGAYMALTTGDVSVETGSDILVWNDAAPADEM